MGKRSHLSVLVLTLYIVGSCTSIRNLSTMALFGSHVVFYYAIAAFGFLIPTALITAELGLRSQGASGIFAWCHHHIHPKAGLLAIWLQWVNTMTWYPSVLAFIASTMAYLINPSLASHTGFMITTILAVYWLLTLMNCYGVQLSAQFASVCTVLGLLIPMLCLIAFAGLWLYHHASLTLSLHWQNLAPHHWSDIQPSAITPTLTACLGMELIAIYAPQIDHPTRTIPKALIYSCQIIIVSTLLGALAIAMVIPHDDLNLIAGTLQTFALLTDKLHLHWLLPLLVGGILIGATGGMLNWMLSPAEGIRQASAAGLLPQWLNHTNPHNAPQRILCVQAILVSIIAIVFVWMPNLNTAYWLLTDLSTELYLCMYPLLFFVAYRMRHMRNARSLLNNTSLLTLCAIGMITCSIGLWVGFMPPQGIGFQQLGSYPLLFATGMIIMLVPVVVLYACSQRNRIGSKP